MKELINLITKQGGKVYLIGGAVIDSLMNRPIKDWDVEVHGLSVNQITDILKELNLPCNMVGQSFGVIKTLINGVDIDLSVPRTENRVGVGHKGFNVELNPNLTPKEAARRRDLTINAMYKDLYTSELIDPFNGLDDLNKGIIRATNPDTFIEDPLRVLRIMQLLPRKGKVVDPHTLELCRGMVGEFKHLPKERIFEEWYKLLMMSDKPSLGLTFLKDSGWIIHFPELMNLIGCPQNPLWHPEGSVWNHTLMVLDNAAKLRHMVPEELRLAYMFGALLHDIGKPSTTLADLTAHGHDEAGVPLTLTFMKRITNDKGLLDLVPKIVKYHMRPGQLHRSEAKLSAWKRLHCKLRLDLLGYISKADSAGRPNRDVLNDNHEPSKICFDLHESLGVEIEPLVKGRDLIALGMEPGPHFGTILRGCMEMQLEGMSKENIINHIKNIKQ